MPETPLVIVQDEPNKYHFKTKDQQRVDIEHKDDHLIVTLFKWGEETLLQIDLDAVFSTQHNFLETENRIEIENPDLLLRVYPIDTRSTGDFYSDSEDMIQCHDGGLRFELVLKKKRPAMGNSLSFPLVAKNLSISHQPFLTQEEIEQGTIRPMNVEDSHVFKHTTKKNNQYMTGKAFHLFRPIAEDALGNKAWCSVDIDPQITHMILTIPQQFLDEATYPITIDPDFGYTFIGGTSYVIAMRDGTGVREAKRRGSAWTWPATCTANWIEAYIGGDVPVDCMVFINEKDSGGANIHDQIAVDENLDCIAAFGWKQFTLAGEVLTAAVVYILNMDGNGQDIADKDNYYYVKGDVNDAVASYFEEAIAYVTAENPWTKGPEGTTIDYSIYCNYTVAAAGWTGTISGVVNPAKIAGVDVANIATVKGVA